MSAHFFHNLESSKAASQVAVVLVDPGPSFVQVSFPAVLIVLSSVGDGELLQEVLVHEGQKSLVVRTEEAHYVIVVLAKVVPDFPVSEAL